MSTTSEEDYLGDGLYASYDGWMIKLRAPREHGDHWVGLEPQVFTALLQYAHDVGMLVQLRPRLRPQPPDDPATGGEFP